MQLLTQKLRSRFEWIGRQEGVLDSIVVAKFFAPSGEATWFATEFYPEDRRFFGFVQGVSPHPEDDEWAYFSLDELEQTRVPPFNLPIERDLYWTEGPFSQVVSLRKRYFSGH